jgi:hypothetical protein
MGTYVRTQEISHPVGERGSVVVRVTDAELQVKGVAGSEARVRAIFEIRADSDEEADAVFAHVQLEVERGDGLLDVHEPGQTTGGLEAIIGRLFRGRRGQVDLAVEAEVPHGCNLRVDTVSGDLTAAALDGAQHYGTVSGDLLLTDVAGSITSNAVSGDASIRARDTLSVHTNAVSGDASVVAPELRGVRCNSVSGDVELEGRFAAGSDHRIDTVSGDLRIGLIGGATVEVRGLSTDVRSSLPHRVEGRLDRRRLIVGDGTARIVFSSMSGDVLFGPAQRTTPATQRPPAPAAATSPVDLEVLRALERGEIDVEEAGRRLAGGPTDA